MPRYRCIKLYQTGLWCPVLVHYSFSKGLSYIQYEHVIHPFWLLLNSLTEQYALLHNTFKQQGKWQDLVLKEHPGNTCYWFGSLELRKWNVYEPWSSMSMIDSKYAYDSLLWTASGQADDTSDWYLWSKMELTDFPRKFWTLCIGADHGPKLKACGLTLTPSPGIVLHEQCFSWKANASLVDF